MTITYINRKNKTVKKNNKNNNINFNKSIKTKFHKYNNTYRNRKRNQTSNQKNNSSIKSKCAPQTVKNKSKRRNNYIDNSCFSVKQLQYLKNRWNERNYNDTLKTDNPSKIWKFFQNKFETICNSERCWLNQEFIKQNTKKSSLKNMFVPEKPLQWNTNPTSLIDSNNILHVMEQYEMAYPYFKFIGPSPIDFKEKNVYLNNSCVCNLLCNFQLKYYIDNKINQIGIIFNTHPHTKGGEHWISLYIDLKQNVVCFFDSEADNAPKEIMDFVNIVMNQGKHLRKRLMFIQNKIVHQRKNTECGMYSIHFIIQSLNGNMMSMLKKRISDHEVQSYRDVYFSK
jgi:hypothetical protein